MRRDDSGVVEVTLFKSQPLHVGSRNEVRDEMIWFIRREAM